MRIYCTNMSDTSDYAGSEKFDSRPPVYLTTGPIFVRTVRQLYEHIKDKFEKSQPDDFLIISGSAVISSIIVSLWRQKHGQCRLLVWRQPDRRKNEEVGKYEEILFPDFEWSAEVGIPQNV